MFTLKKGEDYLYLDKYGDSIKIMINQYSEPSPSNLYLSKTEAKLICCELLKLINNKEAKE